MKGFSESAETTPIQLTARIVSAYLHNNAVEAVAVPDLIRTVHAAITRETSETAEPRSRPAPPVPVKKSVADDYIVSLEDGRRYKSLRRHLSGRGLTPEQYRQKWSLPYDYPMVAPNYAKQRSDLAKSMGLGLRTAEAAKAAKAAKSRRTNAK